MSKKKDQEKFNEYAINTDDAWEIDDRTMTLKILDNGDSNDSQPEIFGISKQVFFNPMKLIRNFIFFLKTVDEVASRVIQEHKSKSQSNKVTLDASAGKKIHINKFIYRQNLI